MTFQLIPKRQKTKKKKNFKMPRKTFAKGFQKLNRKVNFAETDNKIFSILFIFFINMVGVK